MPAAADQDDHATETLVFEGDEALKSLEVKDGKARVGAYAIRFSTAAEKDLTGDYFTKETDFGSRKGDGAFAMFNHGLPIGKGLEHLSDRTFGEVSTRADDTGIFAETVLDMSDQYQAAIAKLCDQGKLKWSSGSATHVIKKAADGHIKRWPIVEFSFTPTPAESRLPAIRPMKSVVLDDTAAAALAADLSAAGVDIAQHAKASVTSVTTRPAMPDKTPEQLETERKAAIDSAVKARELVIEEITTIGEQFKCVDAARSFIKEGKSPEDFRKHVMTDVLKARPVDLNASLIGMSGKELARYSPLKAIREACAGGLSGLELDAHKEALKRLGSDFSTKGFIIPEDVLRAANRAAAIKGQVMNNASLGGFTMQPDVGPMIPILRNKARVIQAGATVISGLSGDLFLPQQLTGATAYWVSETGTIPDSGITFAQKKMTPHRIGITVPYSGQFIKQSSLDAESFITNDARAGIALEKDRAALLGSGANGEPVGLLNTVGINRTVTYGGAATFAAVVESETGIANSNADSDTMAFILGVSAVGKWKTKLKDIVAGAGYLIDANMTANGYPVFRTVQAGTFSFFGDWSELVIGGWGGLECIVDPLTLATSNQVRVTMNELCDIAVRQSKAFNVSTDSAAQ